MVRKGLVGASLFLIMLVAVGSVHAQSSAIGTVVSTEGEVLIELVGGGQPKPLKSGDIIRAGDRVKTTQNSKARLVMKDDTILVMGSNSMLDFSAFDYDEVRGSRSVVLNFLGGTLRAIVSKMKAYGQRFDVRTPTATIGVRGTHMIIEVDPESGATKVLMIEGRAAISNSDPAVGGQITLGSMEQTEVDEGQPPAPGHVPTDEDLTLLREQSEAKFNRELTQTVDPMTLPGPLTSGSPLARQALLDDLVRPPQSALQGPQTTRDPTKATLEIQWLDPKP